jgi:uncharacterized protein
VKIRHLDLSSDAGTAEHNALGLPPLETDIVHPGQHPWLRAAMWAAVFLLISAMLLVVVQFFVSHRLEGAISLISETLQSRAFWSAVAVGLLAQTIDGALGMAYGITSTTFLMAAGASPLVATASVHIAEVFTTGVSGISHVRLGNVDKRLFFRLLVPGFIGAVGGALLVSQIDGALLKPYVSAYLAIMGLYVLSKVFKRIKVAQHEPRHVGKLALFGGFLDAVGGGGWGPVVTTTLIGSGHNPRTTIGSVNFAEFFLTVGSAGAFAILVEQGPWATVAGLVLGGFFAAPIAAVLCRRLPARVLLVLVGVLITAISMYNLHVALG